MSEDQSSGSEIPVWVAYVLLVFTALCWAGSSVAGRAASSSVPPMTLSFIRWFIAFLIFLPFGGPGLWRQRAVLWRHFPLMCAFSFFGVVGFTVPYYVGLQYTEAVNASLLNAASPIMMLLLAWAMLGTRMSRAQWAGIALALTGALTIVFRGDPAIMLALHIHVGDGLVLACFFSWALYTVMLKWRPEGIGQTSFIVALFGLASVMMLPMYLWELGQGRTFEPDLKSNLIIGYAALFPSALGYICWNIAVKRLGPGPVSYSQYLIPVFGVLLSMIILGETVQWFHLAGIACIFTGIYLATTWRRRAGL